ncbi:GH25 family lysozyme [Nostoc sp. T09]|uniref:GH25 family lysozyme n=1 Tax=Nostoc sp. T09 TaxID=1932621 RepID=UPI000A365435|nr:GH25 family lysozyme [Nostoc sp. T09]
MAIEGIDIAEFSGNINWEKVRSQGIRFAFARVNDGTIHTDTLFSSYWPAMKKAGIIRGAYFFFRPTQDIDAQVKIFVQNLEIEPGDLPPVVDIETANSWYDLSLTQRLERVAEVLNAVELATGYKPIIYTGPSFWRDTMGNTKRFADYDLWIAHYQTSTPSIPGGWEIHTFHQYIGDQTGFPGIPGDVDRNRFNGTLDRLQAETVKAVALVQGRIGPKVKKLQQNLKKLGFDPGVPDGIFGTGTKKAVTAYQQANKLTVTATVPPGDKLLVA